MEKEFKLSEKIDDYFGSDLLGVGDVKEFIRRLKGYSFLHEDLVRIINKLAGDDLI